MSGRSVGPRGKLPVGLRVRARRPRPAGAWDGSLAAAHAARRTRVLAARHRARRRLIALLVASGLVHLAVMVLFVSWPVKDPPASPSDLPASVAMVFEPQRDGMRAVPTPTPTEEPTQAEPAPAPPPAPATEPLPVPPAPPAEQAPPPQEAGQAGTTPPDVAAVPLAEPETVPEPPLPEPDRAQAERARPEALPVPPPPPEPDGAQTEAVQPEALPVPPPPPPPASPPQRMAAALPRARPPAQAPTGFPMPQAFSLGPTQPARPDRAPRADPSYGPAVPAQTSFGQFARITKGRVEASWMNALRDWWDRNGYYPRQAAALQQDGTVRIEIVVDRWGKVHSVELLGRSGSQFLDLGAQAVFRGATVPPFPPNSKDDQITLELTVNYILIRR
ncbi:MAG: energy transducer TonB [Acetobacteraceae bacterium]